MIEIGALKVGSVVRLASGSIKLVVAGFSPKCPPGHTAPRTAVELLGWSDRQGFVRITISPALLVWPRPAQAPDAEPDVATEDAA